MLGLIKQNKKRLINILLVALGNLAIAAAVSAFIAPTGIIMGGATGVSLVLVHYFNVSLSATVFVVSGLLFVIGSILLGKEFAFSTLASTVFYPLMLRLLEMVPFVNNITDDLTLCTVLGALLFGCGIGLNIKAGGSSGGTDVIGLIAQKYLHINFGMVIYAIDGTILLLQAVFSNKEQILYGILFLIIQVMVLNRTMLAGKVQIQMMIISDRYEEIRNNLLRVQDVGATLMPIEKGLTAQPGKCVICVTSRKKVAKITEMVNGIDPDAFLTIYEVNEVRGHGFTSERIKL